MKKVVGKMGADQMTIAYGQTEASPVITQTRHQDTSNLRVTTVGRALESIEVKIVDAATAKAVDHDGWLHTGDLAVMDGKGYCKITGRIKNMKQPTQRIFSPIAAAVLLFTKYRHFSF